MGTLCKDRKAKQAVYDAIKKCREEGEAWVTFKGKILKLVDADLADTGYKVLVKRRGRIVLDKDGLRLANHGRYIQWDDVLATVTENHDR